MSALFEHRAVADLNMLIQGREKVCVWEKGSLSIGVPAGSHEQIQNGSRTDLIPIFIRLSNGDITSLQSAKVSVRFTGTDGKEVNELLVPNGEDMVRGMRFQFPKNCQFKNNIYKKMLKEILEVSSSESSADRRPMSVSRFQLSCTCQNITSSCNLFFVWVNCKKVGREKVTASTSAGKVYRKQKDHVPNYLRNMSEELSTRQSEEGFNPLQIQSLAHNDPSIFQSSTSLLLSPTPPYPVASTPSFEPHIFQSTDENVSGDVLMEDILGAEVPSANSPLMEVNIERIESNAIAAAASSSIVTPATSSIPSHRCADHLACVNPSPEVVVIGLCAQSCLVDRIQPSRRNAPAHGRCARQKGGKSVSEETVTGPAGTAARVAAAVLGSSSTDPKVALISVFSEKSRIRDETLRCMAEEGIDVSLCHTNASGSDDSLFKTNGTSDLVCHVSFENGTRKVTESHTNLLSLLKAKDYETWYNRVERATHPSTEFFRNCRVLHIDRFLVPSAGNAPGQCDHEHCVLCLLMRRAYEAAKARNVDLIVIVEPGCAPSTGPFAHFFRKHATFIILGPSFLFTVMGADMKTALGDQLQDECTNIQRHNQEDRNVKPKLDSTFESTSSSSSSTSVSPVNECLPPRDSHSSSPQLSPEPPSPLDQHFVASKKNLERLAQFLFPSTRINVNMRPFSCKDGRIDLGIFKKNMRFKLKALCRDDAYVVLTLRSHGAMWFPVNERSGGDHSPPAHCHELCQYTWSCGDIFRGIIIAALNHGASTNEAVHRAVMLATARTFSFSFDGFLRRLHNKNFVAHPLRHLHVLGDGICGIWAAKHAQALGFNVRMYANNDSLQADPVQEGQAHNTTQGAAAFAWPFHDDPANSKSIGLAFKKGLQFWSDVQRTHPTLVLFGKIRLLGCKLSDVKWYTALDLADQRWFREKYGLHEIDGEVRMQSFIFDARILAYRLRADLERDGLTLIQQTWNQSFLRRKVENYRPQQCEAYVNATGCKGPHFQLQSSNSATERKRMSYIRGDLLRCPYRMGNVSLEGYYATVILQELPLQSTDTFGPQIAYFIGHQNFVDLGGSFVNQDAPHQVPADMKQELFDRCIRLLPKGLSDLLKSYWAEYQRLLHQAPRSSDSIPKLLHTYAYRPSRDGGALVGQDSGNPLWHLYGHGGCGWTLAPADAKTVVDEINQQWSKSSMAQR